MPKSINTVRPSGRTMRLPPCRSPWKTPKSMAPSMNDTSPACSTASVSTPASFIVSTSSHGMPSSRSITSTRRVTSVGCGRGTIVARWLVSASTRAMSSMFCASRQKSSSSTIVSANSSTSAGGLASAATGMRPMSRGASHDIARMSSRTRRATCGRCTFTTTSSPVRRRAACTCAIDAAAIGDAVEALEHVVERAAEVELHDPAHDVERLGRHAVAEQLELGDELGREEPLAAGDDLAELDVGGAERAERVAQPPGQAPPPGLAAAPLVDRGTSRRARRPTRLTTRATRPTGGSVPGSSQRGNSSRAWARLRSTSARHVIASGSTTQGP